MNRIMNMKNFFAPSAWRLGGAVRRAATALLLCVLTMTVQTAWAETETINVSYIDADGQQKSVTATVLTGSETSLGIFGTTTWYVVNSNISHNGEISSYGDVNIILADGKKMTTSNNDGNGINGDGGTLTIYGQNNGTGTLEVNTYSADYSISSQNVVICGGTINVNGEYCGVGIKGYSVTINGGTVTVSNVFIGILSVVEEGAVTINGGTVTAIGESDGIMSLGTITLGWTNATDRIKVNSFDGGVTIANGKALKDASGNVYCGTLSDTQKSAIANVTLQPASQAEYTAALPFASWSGSGTEADPYKITSASDLEKLRDFVNNGTNYYNKYFKQTADITLSGSWTPIGSDEYHSFSGTFNGDSKTISGINISSSGDNKGLFGFVGRNEKPGIIQNLTLANSTITGANYVGGIVGNLLNGTVSNCHVLSSVSILASSDNSLYFGGIVGRTYPQRTNTNATIENCTSAALVTNNGHNNCSNFGGIVGYNYYYSDTYFSKVTDCFYYGTAVSASSEAGAIVGYYYRPNGISNCYYNCPSTISGIGYGNTDIGTTRVYTVTCTTSGLSTTGTATYTHNGTHYFAAGATVTVTLGASDKTITSLSAASGTISNVSIAPDGQSATFTVGSSDVTDVTVSATLKALSGTCGNNGNVTWSLGGTNYTELTISGTGTMQNFEYSTDGIWKTKAPWGTDITKVTIGDGVTSIGNYAFIGCENLASITIGSGVTSIGIGAVNHCDQMTTVTLPASVTTIAYAAFENCQKLETIYINHDGEVSLTGNNDNAFNAPLLQYIAFPSPAGALANTKETGNWARYKDIIRAQFGNQLFTATNEGGTPAYVIANPTDLTNLATAVNGGSNGSGQTFRQTADISVGSTFPMIGSNNTNSFGGIYDGNHKTLTFNYTATDNYTAPFRYVKGTSAAHAVIRDLTVSSTITSTDCRHPAGLVANQQGYLDVTGCNVTVNINTTVGTNNPSDLYPAGLVSQVASSAQLHVSGCTVGGTITSNGQYTSGMIAVVQGSASISGCTVGCTINTSAKYAAGYISTMQGSGSASITNCVSSVTINSSVSGDGTHGGFIGAQGNTLTIEGCVFNGKLLSRGTKATTSCGGFVGWKGGTVNISNSLYAPAALIDDETWIASDDSYTFSRRSGTNITNCYYTQAFGEAQGTAVRTVSAGEFVTTCTVSPVGNSTNSYNVSDITAYNDGLVRGSNFYYGNTDVVSLTLGCTPPAGYTCTGYTATAGNLNGTTLTMPNENVTINVTLEELPEVSYIDENGTTHTTNNYTIISDNSATTFGQYDNVERWYVVTGTVNFASTIEFMSNSNIIIADGAVLNVGTAENPVSDHGIKTSSSSADLKIYAESGTTGHVSVYSASNSNWRAIYGDGGELVIVNCEVNASGSVGIYDTRTGINIVGCQLNLAGGNGVKSTTGPVTLKNTTLTAPSLDGCVIYSPVDLTLDNCTVVAATSATNIHAITSNGGTNGIIIKNNSNINVKTTTNRNSNGIFSQMGVSIEGSTVEAKGNRGIVAGGAVTITDATVKATSGSSAIWAGSSITLDGSDVTAKSGYHAIYANNGNITIRNNGKTVAESPNDYGCYAIFTYQGGNVIIESGSVEATGYRGITANGNVNISGGQVKATGLVYGIWAAGNLTLGWTNANDSIYASSYYVNGGTLAIAEGKAFIDEDGNTYESGPVDASAIASKTLYPRYVTYLDENGEQQLCTEYTLLQTGMDLSNSLPGGWYVAEGTVNFNHELSFLGDFHIILKDNAVMTIGTEQNPVNSEGIRGYGSNCSISFYAQSTGDSKGQLHINSMSYGIYNTAGDTAGAANVIINGGGVTIRGEYYGIYCYHATINGGEVTATGLVNGILGCYTVTINGGKVIGRCGNSQYSSGGINGGISVTLGWRNATDFIYSDKYYHPSTIAIAEGQAFIDEDGHTYSGTIAWDETTQTYPIDGKTLYPYMEGWVPYLDENGERQFCTEYTPLNGNETTLGTADQETWYVADGTLNYGQTITLSGDVHLILKDNAVMNVGTQSTITYGIGDGSSTASISIYGQSTGNSKGQLHVNASAFGIFAKDGNLTINGGEVVVTSSGTNGLGIYANGGNIIINGGEVEATGSENGGEGIIVLKSGSNGGSISISNATVTASGSIGIHAQSGITINSGTVTTNNCNYGIYASSCSLTINGGQVTANGSTYGIWSEGDLTLGWTNASDYIHANSYLAGGTLSIAEGKAFIDEDGIVHTSGTVNASAINGKTLYPYIQESVPYLDENGEQQLCTEYTVLTGTETSLAAGWYVAYDMLNYSQTLTLSGDVHLILKDNAVMNVTSSTDHGINGNGHSISIYAQSMGSSKGQLHVDAYLCGIFARGGNVNICGGEVEATGDFGINAFSTSGNGGILTISNATVTATGESMGIYAEGTTINSGTVTANGNYGLASYYGNGLNINGGTVTANGNYGLASYYGNGLNINGGQVTANGSTYGIYAAHGNITLGWTNASDYIYANSYHADGGTLSIAEGKAFINAEGDIYESGPVDASDINGKTLRPYSNSMLFLADDANNTAIISKFNDQTYNVTLAGRKLWKDGAWNTLVLPFAIANIEADGCPLKGATVRELNDASITGTTLNLTFKNATTEIAAGVPYIVKWDGGTEGEYTENPVFQGVTIDATPHSYDNQAGGDTNVRFIGTYDQKTVNTEDQSILFLGAANTLYYPSGQSATTIGACRAYFKIGSGTALARQLTAFNLNFADGESQGIVDNKRETITNNHWYTLDGVRLDAQPTRKGLYIHGGRKVVIK